MQHYLSINLLRLNSVLTLKTPKSVSNTEFKDLTNVSATVTPRIEEDTTQDETWLLTFAIPWLTLLKRYFKASPKVVTSRHWERFMAERVLEEA